MIDKGYLVVSELSWLRSDAPSEINEYMKQVYPPIKTIQGNLNIAEKVGYSIVESFVLGSESWWTNYYAPILAKLPSLKEKYRDHGEKLQRIACRELEIEMFSKYSDYYGYVFYEFQC